MNARVRYQTPRPLHGRPHSCRTQSTSVLPRPGPFFYVSFGGAVARVPLSVVPHLATQSVSMSLCSLLSSPNLPPHHSSLVSQYHNTIFSIMIYNAIIKSASLLRILNGLRTKSELLLPTISNSSELYLVGHHKCIHYNSNRNNLDLSYIVPAVDEIYSHFPKLCSNGNGTCTCQFARNRLCSWYRNSRGRLYTQL